MTAMVAIAAALIHRNAGIAPCGYEFPVNRRANR